VGHFDAATTKENEFVDCESPPPIIKRSESDRSFTSSSLRENMKILNDPVIFQEYKMGKKKHFDILSILPTLCVCGIFLACRMNWTHFSNSGPYFFAAHLLIFVTEVLFWPYIFSVGIIYCTSKEKRENLSYKRSVYILTTVLFGRIDDVMIIFGTLAYGFTLLARVLKGQCDSSVTSWESQRCNPVASLNSIPFDQCIILLLVPITAQFCLRGVSVHALIASWICILFFVIFSMVYVGGRIQAWSLISTIVFMNINWEVERVSRVFFVTNKSMLAANRLSVELENMHQINLLKNLSENERKLADSEKNQLRSLMGNVAHDLKTPLHSIEADLEMLILIISKIPVHIIEKAVTSLQSPLVGNKPAVSSCCKQSFDPQSIFNAMNATCKFMEMSINRSQDFMKASNNISLLPALESFGLAGAIGSAVTCIKHMLSERLIVVHPFDKGICEYLVSDKHWLTENMLCLLSNAIKYGDKGHVDVNVQVVDDFSSTGPEQKGIEVRPTESADSTVTMRDVKKRMVLVTVEDSGIGICEEARKKLFQPFKQAQRMAGGTGLGLYSLLKRVEALGGEAGVASRTDHKQGSMFWFTFPYRPDKEAAAQAADELRRESRECTFGEATASVTATGTPERKLSGLMAKNILLIDDSPSVLRVTSRFLLMNYHTVVTAPNGCAGLEILKDTYGTTQQFDLVLTDMQMPVMDGIEATIRFRIFEGEQMKTEQGCRNKRLMIVGMSANSDDQTKQEALSAGVDAFVTKPFTYKALRHLLKNPNSPAITSCSSLNDFSFSQKGFK